MPDTRSTPFMDFWLGLNRELERQGLPELTLGPARRLWDRAIADARMTSLQAAFAKLEG